ncbi:uncharacterized protein LOC122859863 [Aphidius gifuensis]|uniref:uncharacterized protein LOC122859863 n=1 Tax=Aphidius gifuensis TaxID=684658 RepID=UPI001CDCC7E1|nr:uncharacterized protein LOC122859863 [Aphidius gifuensis]
MYEFKWDIVKELHAPARGNFERRHVDIRNFDETWQADLIEMIPYSKENQGYKYLAVPIRNKTGKDVSSAMESILKGGRVPKKLHANEIFTIMKINRLKPPTYKLKDYQNNPIGGCFYKEELLKVKHSDIFLIERVIKTRGNKIYVEWLGFDDSHNQWIDK